MALSVKKKIWLGTLFLFSLLLLTGGAGIYYMAKLKREGKNVLQDNYESLAYCHVMQKQLSNIEAGYDSSIKKFEDALIKQEANITEPGEKTATGIVRLYFDKVKGGDTVKRDVRAIENQLQEILKWVIPCVLPTLTRSTMI